MSLKQWELLRVMTWKTIPTKPHPWHWHSLSKLAGIVQCNAIIANREAIAESAKQFNILYKKKWEESISAAALGTLRQAKWNKPQVLPFTQDVSLLHKFLATESSKYMKDIGENPNNVTFSNLAKVTLTQIVLFNRKRQGEVSKMELRAFTSWDRAQLNPDIMMCLSDLEKKLALHFDRVEIRGKRSRMVLVLLTPEMVTAMDLLVKHRTACEVSTENVYFFCTSRCPFTLQRLWLPSQLCKTVWRQLPRGTHINKIAETSCYLVHSTKPQGKWNGSTCHRPWTRYTCAQRGLPASGQYLAAC